MACSAVARAEVLFDSLDSPNSGDGQALTFLPYATFNTTNSTFHGADIKLLLSGGGTAVDGNGFTVSIGGGVPLSDVTFDVAFGLSVLPGQAPVLGSVTLPFSDLSTTLSVVDITQFAAITLQPNSLYWIGVSVFGPQTADGPFMGWGTTTDNSGVGVAAGYSSSDYTDFFFYPNNNSALGGGPAFQMKVSAEAAPEPSTWAMMLIGLAGLGFTSYRLTRGTAAAAG